MNKKIFLLLFMVLVIMVSACKDNYADSGGAPVSAVKFLISAEEKSEERDVFFIHAAKDNPSQKSYVYNFSYCKSIDASENYSTRYNDYIVKKAPPWQPKPCESLSTLNLDQEQMEKTLVQIFYAMLEKNRNIFTDGILNNKIDIFNVQKIIERLPGAEVGKPEYRAAMEFLYFFCFVGLAAVQVDFNNKSKIFFSLDDPFLASLSSQKTAADSLAFWQGLSYLLSVGMIYFRDILTFSSSTTHELFAFTDGLKPGRLNFGLLPYQNFINKNIVEIAKKNKNSLKYPFLAPMRQEFKKTIEAAALKR